MTQLAWGLDYKKVRPMTHKLGERWLLTLTRLSDGELLATWHSAKRPGVEEVWQVLARAILKHIRPDVIWCDVYLKEIVAPFCEREHIVLSVRIFEKHHKKLSYDERLDRAMPMKGRPPLPPVTGRKQMRRLFNFN